MTPPIRSTPHWRPTRQDGAPCWSAWPCWRDTVSEDLGLTGAIHLLGGIGELPATRSP
jgi:hypothetical protein